MATIPVRQSRFLGEISPDLYGRTDHPLYVAALRRMWNFFSTPQGSSKNRAGTKLVASTKNNGVARLIPFVFSSTQTYMLEFGNLYVRFHQNGGLVIFAGAPYEVATPFTTAMLPYLKYAQVGDTMTLCYGGQEPGGAAAVAPRELKRVAHTTWTIAAVSFAPPASVWGTPPSLNTALPQGQQQDATHYGRQWWWTFTALLKDANGNVYEGLPFELGLTQLPQYNPIFSYSQGAIVSDGGVKVYTSMVNANLGNAPPISPASWNPGIVIYPDKVIQLNTGIPTLAGYTLLGINVYRNQDGAPGFLAFVPAGQTTFSDAGATCDFSVQPPKSTDPFAIPAGDYPACVAFFEGRRLFGRQAAHPQRLQGSRTGKYSNFDVDLFVKDDDAIQFDIASQQLDEIRAFIPLRTLLAFTQSGEYAIEGFQGPLSPSSVDVRRQMGSRGSAWLDPLVIGNTVLHVQDSGNSVRDLVHDWRTDTYNGTYVSLQAAHLFEGRTIVDATYQQIPNSIAWFVRDDGVLLGLTYSIESQDPAMQVVAWHKHTTDGVIENACAVREGPEDALYLVVRRTINGATKRYVERMASRVVTDIRTCCFLDCAVSADGRNLSGTTMAFLSDSTYAGGEEGTITASAAAFVLGAGSTDIGDAIVLDPDGSAYFLTILSVTDATHARARLERAVPAAFQNVASASWGWARDSFLNLDHLEGKSVKLLGDGDPQGPFVVAGGQIVGVSPPVVIAQIGLVYQPLLEPLDVPGDVAKGKQKIVKSVAAEVVSSRGMKAGEDETNLYEWDDERSVDVGLGVIPLLTGRMKVRIQDSASPDGRATIVQDDPLPLTIVAMTREIAVGGDL